MKKKYEKTIIQTDAKIIFEYKPITENNEQASIKTINMGEENGNFFTRKDFINALKVVSKSENEKSI